MSSSKSAPLGAIFRPGGVNFSLYSRHAVGVELCFFDAAGDARPSRTVSLDPRLNKTWGYWHALVPGVEPGQLYGYRVDGPDQPARGLRFVSILNQRWPMKQEPLRPLTLIELLRAARRTWHGVALGRPDWSDDSHSLAITADVPPARLRLHLIVNAYWVALEFALPPLGPWRRRIDTALDSPDDIVAWELAPAVPGAAYRAQARSLVLLFAALATQDRDERA